MKNFLDPSEKDFLLMRKLPLNLIGKKFCFRPTSQKEGFRLLTGKILGFSLVLENPACCIRLFMNIPTFNDSYIEQRITMNGTRWYFIICPSKNLPTLEIEGKINFYFSRWERLWNWLDKIH
jgi:hypothetical protein